MNLDKERLNQDEMGMRIVEKELTYKEILKSARELRRVFNLLEVQEVTKKEFEKTYHSFLRTSERTEQEFPDPHLKRKRMFILINELNGYYEYEKERLNKYEPMPAADLEEEKELLNQQPGNEEEMPTYEEVQAANQIMEELILPEGQLPVRRESPISLDDEKEHLNQQPGIHKPTYHGGKRPGAGRPSLGEKRTVTLSLDPEVWAYIDQQAEGGSKAAYVRDLILADYHARC